MQRFFIDHIPQAVEIFENDIFHQTTRVLRMQKGDKIILFCGDGLEYLYEFETANKKSVTFVQKSILPKENREAPKNITLYQALPNKLEKLEWIIEKNTEIGVKKIIFFRSDRSQKLFLTDAKKERLKKISIEALEQCGGLFPVEIIFSENNLEQICNSRPQDEYGIVLHTTAEKYRTEDWKKIENFGIFVGPEGGWSQEEISKMNNNHLITVQFGNRIMRTETVGMSVAFLLNSL